jgi:FMN-dependent NADH-azoreductase
MKLLHVVASPRGEKSNTMRVSAAFLGSLREHHENVRVETVDLYHHDLPTIAGEPMR